MENLLKEAFVAGYERLLAWTDLLDRINVFPVADGDTGRNLKISLLPLGRMDRPAEAIGRDLILNATGNSGNIAAAFFAEVLKAKGPADLGPAVVNGRDRARQAVADPQPGSMLTLYDELAVVLDPGHAGWASRLDDIVAHLAESVAATVEMLPVLQAAGVVDAGALGMFIYLEAFMAHLARCEKKFRDIARLFSGRLEIKAAADSGSEPAGVCVSSILRPGRSGVEVCKDLKACADSVVVGVEEDYVKVHLHTRRPEALRGRMAMLGEVIDWSEEKIAAVRRNSSAECSGVHIMTDAAGAMTRKDAETLGVTLLDSCIVMDGRKYPETLLEPEKVYGAMSAGVRVSTAQTSLFQRHQAYQSVLDLYDSVLYLCVGSVYTGNYESAADFAGRLNSSGKFTVLDTGAASGRLGIIAHRTAVYAKKNSSLAALIAFAERAMAASREFVFLDQLKYLAAGGRISRTSGFFGDLLGIKPIITPRPEGAVKAGTVRNRKEQLAFACDRLKAEFGPADAPHLLLQFSDNSDWVREAAVPRIKKLLPRADILLRPLSLTSGAHMGPGTWSLAFLPNHATLQPRKED